MNVEQIQLFGGPKNLETLAIPSASGEPTNTLTLDVTVHDKEKRAGTRQGHYTRVHTAINLKPTHDFEWVGFSTPFVPLKQEQQPETSA